MAQNNMRKMYTETEIQRLAEERVNEMVSNSKITTLYRHQIVLTSDNQNVATVISNKKTAYIDGNIIRLIDSDVVSITVYDNNDSLTYCCTTLVLLGGSYTTADGTSKTITDYHFVSDTVTKL